MTGLSIWHWLFVIIIGLVVFFFVYMLPWIVAKHRSHPNSAAIFFVNLFFGWSLIGWVGCMVWAIINVQPSVVYVVMERDSEMKP